MSLQPESENKRRTKKRRTKPRMSANLAKKLNQYQQNTQKRDQMHAQNRTYEQQNIGKIEKEKLAEQIKGKEYEIKLNEVSNITKDQITAATTYKSVDKQHSKKAVHKIGDVGKYEESALQQKKRLKEEEKKRKAADDVNEKALLKSLRKERETEQTLRLKANQQLAILQKLFSAKLKAMHVNVDDITDSKFTEIKKRLQQTEAARGNMAFEIDRLKTENGELNMKIKDIQRKSPMTKKSMKIIEENIDENSRNILNSTETQRLFEGLLLCYEKKHKRYEERWGKLTNDGELLVFKNENAKEPSMIFDLVSGYTLSPYRLIGTNKTADNEFELISSFDENESYVLRTARDEDIGEWVSNIKIIQYYFKVKSEQNIEDDLESDSEHKDIDIVEEEVETDPFWLDIKEKMDNVTSGRIKGCIPAIDAIDPKDPLSNKWKEVFWKTEYGEFELSCNVRLTYYDTGKLNKDENNILFASVSKYGINSYGSWQKIADNLNRTVNDVMKKYSKLVGIPVKKLKKAAVARG